MVFPNRLWALINQNRDTFLQTDNKELKWAIGFAGQSNMIGLFDDYDSIALVYTILIRTWVVEQSIVELKIISLNYHEVLDNFEFGVNIPDPTEDTLIVRRNQRRLAMANLNCLYPDSITNLGYTDAQPIPAEEVDRFISIHA